MSFNITLRLGKETSLQVKSFFYHRDSQEFLRVHKSVINSINNNLFVPVFNPDYDFDLEKIQDLANNYVKFYKNRLNLELSKTPENLKLIDLTSSILSKEFRKFYC